MHFSISCYFFKKQKFPTRKKVKLAKQFLIKLIPATELESVKDLEKAENMYQKALAYAAELKDSINKAQNISEDNEVNDNEPQDIELVTNEKKRNHPQVLIKKLPIIVENFQGLLRKLKKIMVIILLNLKLTRTI
jgi:hypothetical protein